MDYYVLLVIKLVIAAVLAVLFGNGSVVMFNRMPVRWFEDEGRLPDELIDAGDGGRQRLTSTPWKYIFVSLFGMCGVYLAVRSSVQYETSVLIVLFIMLEIAISDAKYMIVPDQLCILLAVSGVGFIGMYDEWWEQIAGAVIGAVLIIALYGLGRLIYKRDVIGGADLKFYASTGLIAGRAGVLSIFIITELLIALHALILLITNRDALKESRPMLPYAMAASIIYFLFFHSIADGLILL